MRSRNFKMFFDSSLIQINFRQEEVEKSMHKKAFPISGERLENDFSNYGVGGGANSGIAWAGASLTSISSTSKIKADPAGIVGGL